MRKRIIELERRCETLFLSAKQWWHLYTNGKNCPLFLLDEEDFVYSMNLMARCVYEIKQVIVVAFAIMGNHLHIALAGEERDCMNMFATYRRRLSRYLSNRYGGANGLPSSFDATLKAIDSLGTLRNVVAYVNRNGYVADPSCTPFSYKWSTGRYYFNALPIERKVSDLTWRELRRLLKSRDQLIPGDYLVIDNHISPSSFCSIEMGMSMFRDAHHYFYAVSKNVESYSGIATELDDDEFLTDQELFSQVGALLREQYHLATVRELSHAQKNDVARTLRFKYRSSNGQIRRILGLSEFEVNALFPKG